MLSYLDLAHITFLARFNISWKSLLVLFSLASFKYHHKPHLFQGAFGCLVLLTWSRSECIQLHAFLLFPLPPSLHANDSVAICLGTVHPAQQNAIMMSYQGQSRWQQLLPLHNILDNSLGLTRRYTASDIGPWFKNHWSRMYSFSQ